MIERAITGELAGTYVPDYAESGFSCRLSVPLDRIRRDVDVFA